jgi:hypothetical protein
MNIVSTQFTVLVSAGGMPAAAGTEFLAMGMHWPCASLGTHKDTFARAQPDRTICRSLCYSAQLSISRHWLCRLSAPEGLTSSRHKSQVIVRPLFAARCQPQTVSTAALSHSLQCRSLLRICVKSATLQRQHNVADTEWVWHGTEKCKRRKYTPDSVQQRHK